MRYDKLVLSGLAALVMSSSCKFEVSVGSPSVDSDKVIEEAEAKPVVFEENDVMPMMFFSAEIQMIKPQYQKVAVNLVRLYSMNENEEWRGTALLVNPTQILSAAHVPVSPTLEYVISNESHNRVDIRGWIRNIDLDSGADIAVINLQMRVEERPSLQFYDKPIQESLPIALITYDNNTRVIREGEITRVFMEEGQEKFETNIAAILGNSGGVYVDQKEGKIVGVITHSIGKFSGSLGPSIHTLDVQKRERVLSRDEQQRIKEYTDAQEFLKRKENVGYDDFAQGDFYLKGDESVGVEICLEQKLFSSVTPRCFSRYDFPTIVATRAQKSIGQGRGELNIGVKFRDGRTYEVKTLFVPDFLYKGVAQMSSTAISGDW